MTNATARSDARPSDVVDPLTPFVPRLAVEVGEQPTPSWTSVDGSMLSADISGFTALSERLASKGKAGAEEITDLVNKCFTALIGAAYGYGGEVLKFGGDALLVLFRGPNHGRRSVDAGLEMQRALHASTAAKRASLTMTVGVADGPFDVFLVGSSYRELLVTGARATEVIRLEGEAQKGDTLIATTLADLLPTEMIVRHEFGGVVVHGSSGDQRHGVVAREQPRDDLTPYVPATVREQFRAFAGLGGEHRLVSVGFLMVSGIEAHITTHGASATASELHTLVNGVIEACTAFGLTALHTDIAPDGVKFVLCAGAPVNPGDTSDAMLQASLTIAALDSRFVLRQGVQTGRVFAGFLGSDNRKTYTLMGDPVNTAARMLGQAGDRDVVAVESVVAGTRTVFETEPLEPFLVKGKSEPITAHKVLSTTSRIRRDATNTQLVGRDSELEMLTRAIGQLDGVVELVGPAGVGKSRLLDAAWDSAEGLRVFQGVCTPYGAGSPYSVFRPLLRGGSGIPLEADQRLVGRLLARRVTDSAPELLPMLPLLAVPFGARVPSTPEADAIDADHRRARIHETVAAFLDAVLTGPALLVVEDAHWIDDASGDLINHLARAASDHPWAGVITRRPEGKWHVDGVDHLVRIDLQPLDAEAIRALAIRSSTSALTDRDLSLIVQRSEGNPLFAIELTHAVAEGDGDVPDSIERIIASRIDRLPPDTRRLVRTASVLGTQFDDALVREMLSDIDGLDVDGTLRAAEKAGTIGRISSSTWAFHHALYRDTAYEGLPFAHRRSIHRRAASTIEARTPDPDAVAALLSVHFAAAHAHEQAWSYSVRAGEAAALQHATGEAALAYERAQAAGRHCRKLDTEDRARVSALLGDQYYLLGRFDEASRAYERARRNTSDPIADTNLIRKLAEVHERRGDPVRAIRWYRRAARRIPARTTRSEWLIARARASLGEAAIRSRRSEGTICLELSRRALRDARSAEDDETIALALERIHLSMLMLRMPDDEAVGPAAAAAHRSLRNYAGLSRVLTNLGIEAYYDDRWSDALDHYLESAEAAERAGTVVPAATAAINSAEIMSDQGAWARAVELFDGAIRNYQAVRYSAGVAAATLFSAVASMRNGNVDIAEQQLRWAREELDRLGMHEWVDDLDTRRLELDLLTGSSSPERCEDLLRRFGPDHPFRARALRSSALTLHCHGEGERAAERFEEALIAAPGGFERALTLLARGRTLTNTKEAARMTAASAAIFRELQVQQPPPLVALDLSSRT